MTERGAAPAARWSRSVLLYVGGTVAVAVLALVASLIWDGRPTNVVALVTLLVLGLLSVLLREPDVGSKVSFSFLSIIVVSSVALIGPVGSALVAGLSNGLERGRRPLMARLFNAAMSTIQGVVGGAVYLLLEGQSQDALKSVTGPGDVLLRIGLPLMAADVAQMLVNAILLSGVVRLSSGVPPRRFLVQIVTNSGVAYIGYGFIGFLFVILWVPADVGPFSALLILAPLMVARWAFVQFGEEQRAHERALSALVTAVETKDPHVAGHSARIALLSEWMAEPLSMGAQDVQALRFAAMLHDVGKVGVPTRVLRGRRELGHDELVQLTRHADHGAELVRDIEFLAESRDAIRHHHERWDGLGYPDGLAGDAIPLASRVIAVADAFDALTTARPGRPAHTVAEALAEIGHRRGAQFDPDVVAALAAALQRHTWSGTAETADHLVPTRGYVDHDDPVVWERVWRPGSPSLDELVEPREVAAVRAPIVRGEGAAALPRAVAP
jgi:putative nucleotidyltransferase with HDIG domain